MIVLTIVWLHTSEVLLPAEVLAVDLAHVGDEESILISGLARVLINALDALLQGLTNHLLGNRLPAVDILDVLMIMLLNGADGGIKWSRLQRQSSIFLEGSCDGGRCHYHAAARQGLRGMKVAQRDFVSGDMLRLQRPSYGGLKGVKPRLSLLASGLLESSSWRGRAPKWSLCGS